MGCAPSKPTVSANSYQRRTTKPKKGKDGKLMYCESYGMVRAGEKSKLKRQPSFIEQLPLDDITDIEQRMEWMWIDNSIEQGQIEDDGMNQDGLDNSEEAAEVLFQDKAFPANYKSLQTGHSQHQNLEWKRPREINSDAVFVDDDYGRNDIVQGELGDCWLLAAIATMTIRPEIRRNVIPDGQIVKGEDYMGKHTFNFWVFGKWRTVEIDDRLPCYGNSPAFATTKNQREFWVPLLEKAYAKLNGGYNCLDGGWPANALVDFSAGVVERFDIFDFRSDPVESRQLYRRLLTAFKQKAVLSCSKMGDDQLGGDRSGLVGGHAYSLTAVAVVCQEDGHKSQLIRVRNPWGNEVEWNREWGDKSSEWDSVSEQEKQRIDYRKNEDGEFWMPYREFLKHFDTLSICYTTPDFDKDGSADLVRHYHQEFGEWTKGTDGGCRNDMELYATNPQYVISVSEADLFDELTMEPDEDGFCDVHITLMQDYRSPALGKRKEHFNINYTLYLLDDDWAGGRVDKDFFYYNEEVGSSGVFVDLRQVQNAHKLEPNKKYLLVPSTFYPRKRGMFLLRFHAEHVIDVKLLS